eukprot:GDKJ01046470.1.p1 GENE.GDKJ01046470.1~~GDKJ01046470.1.p1  ORF type:complete len:569 (+),score=143.50 GDKJ01046470.1:197-1903(+)
MSKNKAKAFKEPPFFKGGDMYYFDKGTNARILRLLKADKDRSKPKQPPPYSLPPKVLNDPLFQPLFAYYSDFGLEDCPPPPYGSAPADPFPQAELGEIPLDSMKIKGQDLKRHAAYIEKKIEEAVTKRMEYYEKLQESLAKAKKMDKKLAPVTKVSSELEEAKKACHSCYDESEQTIFYFGDMELPVLRIVFVLDLSNGSKTSLPEIKEELIKFITDIPQRFENRNVALGIVCASNKDPVAFKPYLIRKWNGETMAVFTKWLKTLKVQPGCDAGQAKLSSAVEMAINMEPSIIMLATTHGVSEEGEKQMLLDLLSRRCPPGSALQGDDEEDEDDAHHPSGDKILPQEHDEKTQHEDEQHDVEEDDGAVAEECKSSETERALLREMGVDFRVLRLECKMDDFEKGEVTDFLKQCCEAALGPDAVPDEIESCISQMARSSLWKSSLSNVKKAQKMRLKQEQLDQINVEADANSKSIYPTRVLLHGQLAVERTLQFDLTRCQTAMWQPCVPPAAAPAKDKKTSDAKSAKPKSASNKPPTPPEKPNRGDDDVPVVENSDKNREGGLEGKARA